MAKKVIEKKDNTFGIVGLITGILGMLTLPLLFSTLAIIFSAVGLGKKQKYSMAGMIIGVAGWAYGFYKFIEILSILGMF